MSAEAPFSSSPPVWSSTGRARRSEAPLGIELAQEVAYAVGLILGHERRAVAREDLPDRLELPELGARSEPHIRVREPVRPEHTGCNRGRRRTAHDPPRNAILEHDRRPDDPAGDERRRRRGKRLAVEPRRAVAELTEDHHCERAATRRADVEREPEGPPPDRGDEPADHGEHDDRQQDGRDRHRLRSRPEVARGPDPEHLEVAQRVQEVAETGGAAARDVTAVGDAQKGMRLEHRGDGQYDRDDREGPDHLRGRPPVARAEEHHRKRRESREPDHPDDREDVEHRRTREGHRERVAEPSLLTGKGRDERREQRQEQRRGHLLDPAPECVAEEQRRLCAEECGRGAERPAPHERLGQCVERQGEHRGEKRDLRLEEPGGVDAGQLVADPEGQECAERVPTAEVIVEDGLVGRGRELREVAPVHHRVVGEREPGRGVVERDVARECGAPREHDRRREHREDADRRDSRPKPWAPWVPER